LAEFGIYYDGKIKLLITIIVGDEMNVWCAQGYESLAELQEICSAEANFTTSQHSRPIIAMKQDAMTGGYCLTYGDVKIDKATFFDCLMIELGIDIMEKYEHIKNVYKWKGIEQEIRTKLEEERKHLYSKNDMLLDNKELLVAKYKKMKDSDEKKLLKNKIDSVKFKIEKTQERLFQLADNFEEELENELMFNGRTLFSFLLPDNFEYTLQNNMDPNGKAVIITRGVMISGCLNKAILGSASGSISHMLRLNYSARRAIEFVSFYQMIINRWFLTRGFSVGIEDCIPKKSKFIKLESNKCFSQALLNIQTEEDEELRELKVNNSLNNARDVGQRIAKESLSPYNSFVAMIRSGAKGNENNITQITSMLGQQNLEGKRMPMTFGKRSLPHFEKNLENILSNKECNTSMLENLFASRGFVHSGFYKGLTPYEFFFHAVGGREGLIDTAVKTAVTGYMQRKMVKFLEDLQVTYKGTVEDASKHVISFDYGGDNFDGAKIIYRGGDPLFIDVESVCNKLNADYEYNLFKNKPPTETNIEIIEEDDEDEDNISVSDIEHFYNVSERKNNDNSNKIRERVIENINDIPSKFIKDKKYGEQWKEVISKFQEIFGKDTKIKKFGGRKYNYDFEIKSGNNIHKVEFKFNCDKISKLAQFLSLGSNSKILKESYSEFFYDNYLQKMVKVLGIKSEIPGKNLYLKNVHSVNYNIHPIFQELKGKTNEESDDIVNESIKSFLKMNYKTVNLDYLKEKIGESLDKKYLLWDLKNKKFILEEIKEDFDNFQVKKIENDNSIVVSSDDYKYKLLLRWRNHKGVLYPAWQISLK